MRGGLNDQRSNDHRNVFQFPSLDYARCSFDMLQGCAHRGHSDRLCVVRCGTGPPSGSDLLEEWQTSRGYKLGEARCSVGLFVHQLTLEYCSASYKGGNDARCDGARRDPSGGQAIHPKLSADSG